MLHDRMIEADAGRCGVCRRQLAQHERGRPRLWCSTRCRRIAEQVERLRRTVERLETGAIERTCTSCGERFTIEAGLPAGAYKRRSCSTSCADAERNARRRERRARARAAGVA